MNTRASVAYGWGVLILAGGGAYYFAKRSINADRADRAARIEKERQEIQLRRRAEYGIVTPTPPASRSTTSKSTTTPTEEGTPERISTPSSKFGATEVFRSPKGDRFS